jgi:hypothetical protein
VIVIRENIIRLSLIYLFKEYTCDKRNHRRCPISYG